MTAVPGRPPLPPLPPKWTGKYRKRPVVVEAVQLIDDLRNHTEVAAWIEGNGGHAEIPFAEPCLFIETMEGRMRADIGWWVVRGVAGEFYAVRPDIFEETYEPAVGHVRIETGQAAYETWRAAVPDVVCNVPGGAWEDLPVTVQAGFEAITGRQSGTSRERRALKALDELFKIDSDPCNPWNQRAMKIIARGLIKDDAPQPPAADRIVRDILESLCRRDGLSLESALVPGEPARNYALAERLGIGHVFGLPDVPQPAPELPAEGSPPDVRPRADGRRGLDITCGKCGEDYGTNVPEVDDIECPECEARRCPQCRAWYGGNS